MQREIVQVLDPSQIEEAMNLVRRVFMEFEAPEYAPEGVEAFLAYIRPEEISARMATGGIHVWAMLLDGVVTGIIAMRPPCQVSLLFVDKAYHRQGMAKQLLAHALAAYRKDGEPATVHSSPYALEAYRRLGFTETGPEQSTGGIRFIPMASCGG